MNRTPYNIPEREKASSTLDRMFAGQIDEANGKYYICLTDHKTGEYYCVQRENYWHFSDEAREANRLPENAKATVIMGEFVRPMTEYEERLWNEDNLERNVDIYGNVEVCVESIGNLIIDKTEMIDRIKDEVNGLFFTVKEKSPIWDRGWDGVERHIIPCTIHFENGVSRECAYVKEV